MTIGIDSGSGPGMTKENRPGMTVKNKLVIKNSKDLDSVRGDLDDLVMRSRMGTIFQTYEWQRAWWENYGEGEMEILEVRNEPFCAEATEGELWGIGIFERLGKIVRLAGGERTDYMDIVALAGKEKEVWESFLDYFKAEGIEELDLQFVRENSPTFNFFKEKDVEIIEEAVAPFLVLPKTWEEYLEFLDHHERKEIKRKIKKLEEKRFEVRHFDHPEDLRKMMAEFINLYKKSSLEKEKSMDERKEKFYRQLADLMGPKNWLRLSFLYMQGKPVASYLSFIFKNELLLYNAGLDREWSEWSAGAVLLTLMIKKEIEGGRQRFDFLRGGERYKYDLGGKDQRLYRIKLML